MGLAEINRCEWGLLDIGRGLSELVDIKGGVWCHGAYVSPGLCYDSALLSYDVHISVEKNALRKT